MDTSELKPPISLPNTPFCLRLNADKTRAYLCAGKPTEWNLNDRTFARLLDLLRKTGFQNMDEDGLYRAIPAVLEKETPFCLAQGVEPVHGRDGEIRCTFETNPIEKQWQAEDGARADFRRPEEINNVHAGVLLAELIAPTPSKDGVDVLGKAIPARPGRPAHLVAGRNVRLSEDGREAYSEIDGCAKKVGGKIAVDRVKVIDGDVDFHTGNVRFSGDVVILGDVKETFSVEAEGGIKIAGIVDRAGLKAGADIVVEGGLYGKEDVSVEAEGNISAAFAENAALRAGGSIYAASALVSCRARAGDKIHLKAVGKSLIGGHVVAAHGIEANCLGNPRIPTKTIVEFGVRPELAQRMRALAAELKQADENRRPALREELEQLREEYERQRKARVVVKYATYPGVVFRTENASYEVKQEISSMVYYRVEGKNEISMRAYAKKKRGR